MGLPERSTAEGLQFCAGFQAKPPSLKLAPTSQSSHQERVFSGSNGVHLGSPWDHGIVYSDLFWCP